MALTPYEHEVRELNKLLKGSIHALSDIDFRILSEKVIDYLVHQESKTRLAKLIDSELIVTYGLDRMQLDQLEALVSHIEAWWLDKP